MSGKTVFKVIGIICAVGAAVMIFKHRRVIMSVFTGEPLPEPSECAKKWCPPVIACMKGKKCCCTTDEDCE